MNQAAPSLTQRLLRFTWRTTRALGVAYLLVLLLLVVFEYDLIYPAPHYPRGNWAALESDFEQVNFQAADGTKLHGCYLEHPHPRAQVIYFHGNGENVAYLAGMLRDMSQRYEVSVFAFDYRGYGRSEGSPDEPGVLADSDAAVKWLAQRSGVNAADLVLHGRSLGGAAAIDMAARHGARGLILEDTFTSMPDVAAPLYWWAPVRLLMRTQYRSIEKLSAYEGPLLQGHGAADVLVPLAVARRLHTAGASADKRFIEMPGKGHNDEPSGEFYAALGEFYDSLADATPLSAE